MSLSARAHNRHTCDACRNGIPATDNRDRTPDGQLVGQTWMERDMDDIPVCDFCSYNGPWPCPSHSNRPVLKGW